MLACINGLISESCKCKIFDPDIQLCAGGEAGKQHERCFTEFKKLLIFNLTTKTL